MNSRNSLSGRDAFSSSRVMQLAVAAVAAVVTNLLPVDLLAADDPLAPYRAAMVTETEKRDQNGDVCGREVTRRTRVDLKEQIQEIYTVSTSGQEKLVSRTTTTQNISMGKSVTTIESLLNPQADDLVVTSITTTVKSVPGGEVSTTETRDKLGRMVVTSRVTVKQDNGEQTTTIEALNADGQLVVTQQSTFKYPSPLGTLWLP